MLQRLSIKNIALVDFVEITIGRGFTVITGETGSGKSLILNAFSFLLGDKADKSLIRDGATSASVEATFEISNVLLKNELIEAGITIDGTDLIIRRELLTTGKSRIFINNQQALQQLLKKIASKLVLTSGQHAHLTLLSDNAPLSMLDTFGDLLQMQDEFQKSYNEELLLSKEIDKIKSSLHSRQQQLERIRSEVEEIEKAKIKSTTEEEDLDNELTLLAHSDELAKKCSEVISSLDADRGSILEIITKQKNTLEKLSAYDPQLKAIADTFTSCYKEFKEVVYELRHYSTQLDSNPSRLASVEERLHTIAGLKRKYGTSITEILEHAQKSTVRLKELEHIDDFLEQKNRDLSAIQKETTTLAVKLSKSRKEKAKILSRLISQELNELNMPHAIFEAVVERDNRSSKGDDAVSFYLTPNLGEKKINVREAASGGELARLALAFQTILLEKLSISTILFDEIDANIGGKTAAIVGKKLSELGKAVQVISITHFPQVATCADAHFAISKQEKEGRTVTTLDLLQTDNARHVELERMQGL